MYEDSLYHHGIKGQKWGVRRFQDKSGKRTALGKTRYSQITPRKELENGDYLYKKGTVVGRFGGDTKWDQNNDITYLYTNEKDRSVYSERFGGNELIYKFKKNVKMPNLQKQYTDLLEFVKNDDDIKDQYDYAKNEPFDFWKDRINQGGNIANRYYVSMKNKGYDALIDFRNVGMTDDPIIILSPKDSLEKVDNDLNHSEEDTAMGYYDECLEHHGILGQKWGVRRFENAAGHLTAAGKNRYNSVNGEYQKVKNKNASAKVESTGKKEENNEKNNEEKKGLSDKQKKALKIAGTAVGTALVAYGGYKLYQLNKEATEGISKNYSKKADRKINESLDYFKLQSESLKNATNWQNSNLPEGIKKAGYTDALNRAAEYKNKSNAALEEGRKLESLVKSKKYSISEKVSYLNQQKPNSNNTTNKIASEASKLAKSVIAEGPKSFSTSTQNPDKTKEAMTAQKLQAAKATYDTGKKAVNSVTQIAGQQKFSQASKANDDLVNELLKKNASLINDF